MKKISILICLICLSFTKVFALSDLELGVGMTSYSSENGTVFDFVIQNHNFISENEMFGIAEAFTISPWTFETGIYDPNIIMTFFIGPTVRLPLGKSVDFIASTGFKFYLDYRTKTDVFEGELETISVTDKRLYSAYCIAADVQFKFIKNSQFSMAIGVPVAMGCGRSEYDQQPKSTNKGAYYKKLSSKGDYEEFFLINGPYILFVINF